MPSRVVVAKELSEVFKVLSHPDRIRLIEELRTDEKDVNTLHERLDLPASRVSQHLALLRAHRIVEERREGRHVYYHLTQPALADWIIDALRFVEGRISGDTENIKMLNRARKLWSSEAAS
ncbi:MAG: metalloregulator ArsR/SmtB family transcription factor [Pseudomonadota bacterium]